MAALKCEKQHRREVVEAQQDVLERIPVANSERLKQLAPYTDAQRVVPVCQLTNPLVPIGRQTGRLRPVVVAKPHEHLGI